jgi:hypothetical protein
MSRLLESRRLVLVLDLDHTLVNTPYLLAPFFLPLPLYPSTPLPPKSSCSVPHSLPCPYPCLPHCSL